MCLAFLVRCAWNSRVIISRVYFSLCRVFSSEFVTLLTFSNRDLKSPVNRYVMLKFLYVKNLRVKRNLILIALSIKAVYAMCLSTVMQQVSIHKSDVDRKQPPHSLNSTRSIYRPFLSLVSDIVNQALTWLHLIRVQSNCRRLIGDSLFVCALLSQEAWRACSFWICLTNTTPQ